MLLLFIYYLQCLVQVPFRLTRMLVKAMEVSGIEGTFRTTCENVMQVLRTNKDSVMAMMEVRTLCFILHIAS
jgi:phosphatidylinositol kinase/protein kinase (PI-3  family)